MLRTSGMVLGGALTLFVAFRGPATQVPRSPSPGTPIFSDGFENAAVFANLFPADGSRWHNFMQSSGNLIDLEQGGIAHGGTQSLFCFAQPYSGAGASKALISRGGFDFRSGDRLWCELWVRVSGGTDSLSLFLWDLEATMTCTDAVSCPGAGNGSICSSPGRRLYFSGAAGDLVTSDLGKWCVGEVFRQAPGHELSFPKNQWVRIRVYLLLSEGAHGVMRVWQDSQLVLDARGITLPRVDSIYDRLQVGITANGNPASANLLHVDDVSVWDRFPGW